MGQEACHELIDFDAAALEDKRRIRAILGFLPSPAFYAENASDGLMAQDNSMFLGFPGGCDKNIDVTAKELADAYEKMIGPGDVVVLYGAAHAAGILGNLLALDKRWQRVD